MANYHDVIKLYFLQCKIQIPEGPHFMFQGTISIKCTIIIFIALEQNDLPSLDATPLALLQNLFSPKGNIHFLL